MLENIREQYEKFPFPSSKFTHLFAQPITASAHSLAYEYGQFLRTGKYIEHQASTRILVAGSGTLEPIILAKLHPKAKIIALDISKATLKFLRLRCKLSGIENISFLHSDLQKHAKLELFDYIVSTGVLHHCHQPESVIQNFANWLKPTGVLRLMTYAEKSRIWIYELQNFFASQGITRTSSQILSSCRKSLKVFSKNHPLRTSFETYVSQASVSEIIDGFFPAWDEPLSIKKIRTLFFENKLNLLGFGHAYHSQPQAWIQALNENGKCLYSSRYESLDPWLRLSLLDELLELSVNPVFWGCKQMPELDCGVAKRAFLNPLLKNLKHTIRVPLLRPQPNEIYAQLTPRQTRQLDLIAQNFSQISDYLSAGVFYSDEGVLPKQLLENRASWKKRNNAFQALSCKTDDRNSNNSVVVSNFSAAATTLGLTPNVLIQILKGLKNSICLLGFGKENSQQKGALLDCFAKTLEPRVDFRGRELPGLSMGDFLRALTPQEKTKLIEFLMN